MTNKPKQQGTAFETWLVNDLNHTFYLINDTQAERLPEGGSNDRGDIRLIDNRGDLWIIEAKARANLNAHQAIAKAKEKSDATRTALIWKRLTRKDGNARRTPDGEPIIVVMDLDTFKALLGGS